MASTIILIVLLVSSSSQAIAGANERTYSKKVDAMTDEVKRSIEIRNHNGHEMPAYPDEGGIFWL